MIVFGSNETITFKGKKKSNVTTYNWETAYVKYQRRLLACVKEWIEQKISTPGISEQLDVDIIKSVYARVHFLTSNKAYSKIPFIRKINSRIPLFCPSFFNDLANSFQEVSNGIIEVSQKMLPLCFYSFLIYLCCINIDHAFLRCILFWSPYILVYPPSNMNTT